MADDSFLNALETQDGRVRAPGKTLAPGAVVAGQYVVEQSVGFDGLGQLYRAIDNVTNDTVALRMVPGIDDPAARRALIEAARTVRDIRHRNIAAVFAFGEADSDVFTVMEYVRGETLRERMIAGALPLADTLRIADEIAAGLQAAAAAGMLHLDLRPEAVILTPERLVKLIGWGVAYRGGGAVTTGGGIADRPYLAPELRTAPQAATSSADVYALARMVSEMLLGWLPDRGQRLSAERTDIPAAVDGVMALALAGPRQRLASATDFVGRLKAAVGQPSAEPEAAVPDARTTPVQNRGARENTPPELPPAPTGWYGRMQDSWDNATNCLAAKMMSSLGMPIAHVPWSQLSQGDRAKRMTFEAVGTAIIVVIAVVVAANSP